ncbi:unnamed protein product [Eruca vesicaria subsp. sativa]|uniref:RING-type domain-containing protein n=1 Tax=Eruca vesicaria subsp. sativa TaxID=29727 RepID=A0ABC8JE89_ERUVS|nr:unnamed protein product [Eruca vesicaria subsp. sativa]
MAAMNTTEVEPDSNPWIPATDRIGGFAYGLGVSIGILLLITTITLASYYCTRTHISASPTTAPRTRRRQRQVTVTSLPGEERFHFNGDDQNDTVVVEVVGLDDEDIKSFPKLPYEEARVSYSLRRDSTATSCCSICLADYKKTDMIRVLPDCNHLFHDTCVDPWLKLNPTCPVCRKSPLPSPAMTPFVDGVTFSPRAIDN